VTKTEITFIGLQLQDELDRSSRPHRGSSHAMGVLCLVPGPDPRASISSNDSNSIEKDHSGKAAAPYEFSHIPYQAVEPTPSG
jgi:hypothetical protein